MKPISWGVILVTTLFLGCAPADPPPQGVGGPRWLVVQFRGETAESVPPLVLHEGVVALREAETHLGRSSAWSAEVAPGEVDRLASLLADARLLGEGRAAGPYRIDTGGGGLPVSSHALDESQARRAIQMLRENLKEPEAARAASRFGAAYGWR